VFGCESKYLYILNAVRCPYIRSSVTLGVASLAVNDVIMIIAGSWRRGHGLHHSRSIENQSGLLGHDVVDICYPQKLLCIVVSLSMYTVGPAVTLPYCTSQHHLAETWTVHSF